ncbi:MAG: universal stress protein [Desulfobacterales bacterium]|jgi:nucleotide-binding universal stress UspA family protein
MYTKILVPLDGSELAECVLPQVEAITTGCQVSTVVFVRVAEPIDLPEGETRMALPEEQWKQIEADRKLDAQNYLAQLVERLDFKGAQLETQVLFGKAADTLADYADGNDFDLIVIATHGRSGVSRWVWGSVADRILHSACVPVLMVRAPGCVIKV